MKTRGWKHYIYLLRYALPYKKLVITQFILMIVSIGFGLLKPWPLKVLVDNVVRDEPFTLAGWKPEFKPEILLALACISYLIFRAGDSLVQIGSTMVATTSSSKMVRDLRSELLKCLQRLSLKFHDSHKIGDMVYRVSYNTSAVETAFQSGFMGAVKSSLMLMSMFVVMLLLNPLLTAVAVGIVPILIICLRRYAKRIQRISRQHQDQEGAVSSRLQEILSSIRLIKSFGRESMEEERFNQLGEKSVHTRLKMTLVQKIFGFNMACILSLGTAVLFWVGIQQVRAGNLTIGEFLVFNSYLAMLYSPLSVLSYTASSVQGALGGGSRLFDILEAEPEIKDSPGAIDLKSVDGSIRFDSVDFGYEKVQIVLKDINLSVNPGETVAIVGETGGGKTTLLNLILRFYEPWSGRILIDENNIQDITIDSLRRNIALVPQETLLISDSILENIAYGNPAASDEKIKTAAKMAEAHDFITRLPEGYDTLVGERGVFLSAGQRQRIALARAFLKSSPIILLDEPTSALDAETEHRLMERIEEYMSERTVVLVAHRLSTVYKADKIVVMTHGEIEESGTHEKLIGRGGAYGRLWQAQMNDQQSNLGGVK